MELGKESSAGVAAVAGSNPHVLWRQITGLVQWVGVLSYFIGGVVWAIFALSLGGVTFADAWVSGIYKDKSRKSFLNISPMAWGIAMALLFIVAYPAYLISRSKLRTRQGGNGFFLATIILGVVVIAQTALDIIAE